jgi:hypothetical protein
VWCREAEVGVHFIGPGRWWRGGEAAGGSGVLIPIDFEGVKGEEVLLWYCGGSEGGMMALRFGSSHAEEGGSRRRTARWRRWRGGGADGS